MSDLVKIFSSDNLEFTNDPIISNFFRTLTANHQDYKVIVKNSGNEKLVNKKLHDLKGSLRRLQLFCILLEQNSLPLDQDTTKKIISQIKHAVQTFEKESEVLQLIYE